ncbi:MAG: hypothetical protein M1816_002981 [Peltula sp. TS41687]|nr:MAG: hypothetical protein M1816_002981 [Peltula sp. TS41687]
MAADNAQPSTSAPKKRESTVYDAVAGRVAYSRFLPSTPGTSTTRDTSTTTNASAPPDEVLFRRKNAPVRYHEHDIYHANERLPASVTTLLPDSDLLKAVHAYAADFYARATTDAGKGDWRSLDETALMALGILLEEAAVEALGDTGDLVLVEGEGRDGTR